MILDIIIPIYNKDKQIVNYYNKINEELKNIKHNFIFIDNSSTDKSFQVLKELYKTDETNIKVIGLSKSVDKDTLIYAGIKNASHDLICIFDLDLQANVSHITKMYEFLNSHPLYDQVCMCTNIELSGIHKLKINLFNKKFNMNVDLNKTYFRIFRKNIKDAIIEYTNYYKFSKYVFEDIGFNTYYSKFDCKNNIEEFCINKYLPYVKCPLKHIKNIIYLLLASSLILIILTVFKVLNISNNVLVIIILLLFTLIIRIELFMNNYLIKKDRKNIYLIKDKLGFDENVL